MIEWKTVAAYGTSGLETTLNLIETDPQYAGYVVRFIAEQPGGWVVVASKTT